MSAADERVALARQLICIVAEVRACLVELRRRGVEVTSREEEFAAIVRELGEVGP